MGQNADALSPAPQTDDDGDADLLRQYVRHGSQAAFAALVRRYGGLVHATCLREVDDKQLAEDATQVVFLLLARKAPALLRVDSLAGWLFRASRFSARNALRHERRRKVHEQEVIADMRQAHFNGPPQPPWDHLEPVLNAALASLRPHEQEVVLLRYLEGASWRETASRLGLAEDAAQKRGIRAVDKMRRFVNKQGLMLSLAALTALLSGEAARAVPLPAALVAKTVGAVTGGGPASPGVTPLYQGVLHAMKMTTLAATLGGLALVGTVGGILTVRSLPKRQTPQQLLAQVHARYKGLASFSAVETRQGNFASSPGGIVQQLQWHRGGRFVLRRTTPDGEWWPDIYADGSRELAVFPKNGKQKIRALSASASEFQEWPVAGGQILEWLQATPKSEQAFSPNLDKTIIWQYGPRTSWHGRKAEEIIATGPSPKKTGEISFFVDGSRRELIGVELLSPPNGKSWDYSYTDQKDNPTLPTTLGIAP